MSDITDVLNNLEDSPEIRAALLEAARRQDEKDKNISWGSPQRGGRIVQSIEFAEDGVIVVTWANSEDMTSEKFGAVQKVWIDTSELEEWTTTNLVNAVDDFMEELYRWHRGAPQEIPSRYNR